MAKDDGNNCRLFLQFSGRKEGEKREKRGGLGGIWFLLNCMLKYKYSIKKLIKYRETVVCIGEICVIGAEYIATIAVCYKS